MAGAMFAITMTLAMMSKFGPAPTMAVFGASFTCRVKVAVLTGHKGSSFEVNQAVTPEDGTVVPASYKIVKAKAVVPGTAVTNLPPTSQFCVIRMSSFT
jgi:hypothetical protein